MTLMPVQVSFRGIAHSDALEATIRERAAWLEQFYPGMVSCRVLVEQPHRHRHDGRHFHVRIEVTAPGRAPIVISREPSLHAGLKDAEDDVARKEAEIDGQHRDAHVAVREAFNAARRRLQDVAREQRGDVKRHAEPARTAE
jgi:hypothetical protein